MPDLNSWKRDQLKKGYSVKDIDSFLLRKRSAPADVKNIGNLKKSFSSKKITNKHVKNLHSKRFGFIAFIIILAIAGFFLAGNNHDPGQITIFKTKEDFTLQPDSVITIEKDIPGERYSGGVIEDFSSTSITIKKGNKGKSFKLSSDDPPDFFKFNDIGFEKIDLPQIGDNISILLLKIPPAEEPYVFRVFISKNIIPINFT